MSASQIAGRIAAASWIGSVVFLAMGIAFAFGSSGGAVAFYVPFGIAFLCLPIAVGSTIAWLVLAARDVSDSPKRTISD